MPSLSLPRPLAAESAAPAPRWRAAFPRVPREMTWVVVAWAVFIPISAVRMTLSRAAQGVHADWERAFLVSTLDVAQWALLSAATLWVAFRVPLRRERLASTLTINVALAVGLSAARALSDCLAIRYLGLGVPGDQPWIELGHRFVGLLMSTTTLVAAMHALAYARTLREREREALKLEARLARAELSALTMQLQPHFLFNTLNTIASFVHRDARAAEEMIGSLSDLLRSSLAHRHAQEVPLAEELAVLAPYLEIERTRFGDRLTVDVSAGPAALPALVPHLLLQPLVENAVRHGIAPRAAAGRVEVRAERVDGHVRITVRDDGVGLCPDGREGVGLSTTRARLEHLYGAAHRFRVAGADGGGTVVEVEVPYREREEAA